MTREIIETFPPADEMLLEGRKGNSKPIRGGTFQVVPGSSHWTKGRIQIFWSTVPGDLLMLFALWHNES
jgi:hypothetical protein